jgi:hypothetical protein
LRVDVDGSDAPTRERLGARWPEFVSESREAGPPDFRLDARLDPSVYRQPSIVEPIIRREGSRWSFVRTDFEATWDSAARVAELRYASEAAFSSFVRVLFSIVLREHGGALFHAASIRVKDGVYFFPGVSGTGKSTISGLAAPRGVLSDEISALRPWQGRVYAFPTPFWGDMERKRAAEAAPLAAIILLERGGAPSLTDAGHAFASAALLEGTLQFESDLTPDEKRPVVAAVTALARVPCKRLRFSLPENPWPLLDPPT